MEGDYTHFVTKNNTPVCVQIGYDNKAIPNITCTKFLGLLIDNTLTWKNHIELLFNWLSTACYIIWSVKPYMSRPTLITVYYALFHVVMTGGIIFWGNSTHSSKILTIKKRAVRIIMGRWRSESCRNLFKELKILPLKSQYIIFFTFLWLITKATLWQIKKIAVYIPFMAVIYIYLRQTWLFIRKEFIIHVLKSLIIFCQILKIHLAILRDLREF